MSGNIIRITFKETVCRDLFLKKESLMTDNSKEAILEVSFNQSSFYYALALTDDGMIQNDSIVALKEKIKSLALEKEEWQINQLGYAILNDSELLRKQLWEEIQLLQNNRFAKYHKIKHITLEDINIKIDDEFKRAG